jgi:disulfide bond formation protein DsbB
MRGMRSGFLSLLRHALLLAWAFACVGMLLSLYLSEVRGWMPCALCWYQRICLWPLCLILGLALLRKRGDIAGFVLPQVAVGMAIASYQVFIQELAHRDVLGLCPTGPNCATKVDVGLGPVSIPMLSLTAFLATGLLLLAVLRQARSASAS